VTKGRPRARPFRPRSPRNPEDREPPSGAGACVVLYVVGVMRSPLTPWVALFTALAVLLPMSASGSARYFCRMMNRVVATCCCKGHEPAAAKGYTGAQVRSSDCCEKVTTAARSASVRGVGSDFTIAPAALTGTLPASVYFAPSSVALRMPPAQARAPPGVGPPLFIVHCSLLT
jgi:hypothetical protein